MNISACGLTVTLAIFLFAIQGCGYGREMAILASQDEDVRNYFGDQVDRLSFRKELLLPVSGGKELVHKEDFVEVWRGECKAGWVYYIISDATIKRSGIQRIGSHFFAASGRLVDIKSIDTSGVSLTLMDGKEFD